MNSGSKSTHACVPSGTQQHNISSPVRATSNSNIQKETISHGSACTGEASASLRVSVSSASTNSITTPKSVKSTNLSESATTRDAKETPKQRHKNIELDDKLVDENKSEVYRKSARNDNIVVSTINAKNKTVSNIGEHTSKVPSYGQIHSSKLSWSISADSAKYKGEGRGGNGTINTNSDVGDLKQDQVKSRKFVKHWKEAASMSKFGNRTKSLFGIGKFKQHSVSADMGTSEGNTRHSGHNRYRQPLSSNISQ